MRRWVEAVVSGRQRGFAASSYRTLMTLPSWGYGGAVFFRHFLYEMGLKKSTKAALPVVSVGNVMAGGTGKTQLTLALAKRLEGKKKVAVLLRGYPVYQGEPICVEPEMAASFCGDEAKLLANRLEGAIVIVGADRVAGAELARKRGAEVIILDDGMQHRGLARDVEIVLGPAQGSFLPKGRLRDLPSRMKRADLLLEPHDIKSRVVGIFTLAGEKMELPKRVALFCGIGNPEGFVESVREMGCEIVRTLFLADHESLKRAELDSLLEGVDALLCTEKDSVKLSQDLPGNIGWVKIELEVVGKKESWEALLERIRLL